MCIVSNVYDHYNDRWRTPYTQPATIYPLPDTWPWGDRKSTRTGMPSQADLDEFYKILEKAREWDKAHNEPDCESAEKKTKLQAMADEFGIFIEFVS